MIRKTTKVSDLIKSLKKIQKETGDVKVYVVHMSISTADVGNNVSFDGLSSNVAMLAIENSNEKGILVFQSDEILKP